MIKSLNYEIHIYIYYWRIIYLKFTYKLNMIICIYMPLYISFTLNTQLF